MPLVNMEKMLQEAAGQGYAVGAFNVLNHLTAAAAVQAAQESRSPLIIQFSTKTVKQMGIEASVESVMFPARRADVPVALHLDHCTDPAFAKACADAGFTSVMIDASHHPLEENIRITADIVAYASAKGVSVEGELGAISGVEDDIAVDDEDASLAGVDSSKEFMERTGVTAFAPAVGTAHGLYTKTPKLDFQRFADIKAISTCPLVIHGGTGLADEVFLKLISIGAAKINISTAIKIAYLKATKEFWQEHPGESNPLVLDQYITQCVKEVISAHMKLFGSSGKAPVSSEVPK